MTGKLIWDRPRQDKFLRLWLEGTPTREIGRQMDCAQSTVLIQAKRMGLAARNGVPAVVLPPAVPLRPRRTCVWPLGDPGTPGFRFCDELALAGKPYCREHTRVAYGRVKREEEA